VDDSTDVVLVAVGTTVVVAFTVMAKYEKPGEVAMKEQAGKSRYNGTLGELQTIQTFGKIVRLNKLK
jgi:hypothetical protein